jgi:L-asparaginase II
MISHPEVVARSGRANTEVMRAVGGRVFIKDGGEAVTGVGVPERGMGVAAKIEDGGARALPAVTLAALRQLDVLSEEDLAARSRHARPIVCNRKGLAVGEIRATFVLR